VSAPFVWTSTLTFFEYFVFVFPKETDDDVVVAVVFVVAEVFSANN